MKIITWNCNMAFRKKAKHILKYKPDILVVPECEHPNKLKFEIDDILPKNVVWIGNNLNKGLGIFSYSDFKLEKLEIYNEDIKNIVPIKVTNGDFQFTLFAIWANNPSDIEGHYIIQVWKAIHFYEKLIQSKKTILIGDFNSNTIWDKKSRIGNHSDVVEVLANKKIKSTYHEFFKMSQGKEAHSTLFMYRHQLKPYHIDYCFASEDLIAKIEKVEVGDFEDWKHCSDHTPLMVTFNLDENNF